MEKMGVPYKSKYLVKIAKKTGGISLDACGSTFPPFQGKTSRFLQRLALVHVGVIAFPGDEFLVGAGFNDAALVQHDDFVK